MSIPSQIRSAAFALTLAGFAATVGVANATEPSCSGIEVVPSNADKQEYSDLIAAEISADLSPSDRLRSSDVDIYSLLESGGWSAVYGSIPTADAGVFLFESANGTREYRDVWGRSAELSERRELIEWAEQLGAQPDLANCLSHLVVEGAPAAQNFGFTVELGFTARALHVLADRKEKVIVSASYYGEPTPEGEAYADEVGRIDLGREDVHMPAQPGNVEISGSQVNIENLQWADEAIGVNVNVFTARLSGGDNLINCDFIDSPLARLLGSKPMLLRCALIEENFETELRP